MDIVKKSPASLSGSVAVNYSGPAGRLSALVYSADKVNMCFGEIGVLNTPAPTPFTIPLDPDTDTGTRYNLGRTTLYIPLRIRVGLVDGRNNFEVLADQDTGHRLVLQP